MDYITSNNTINTNSSGITSTSTSFNYITITPGFSLNYEITNINWKKKLLLKY